MTTKNECCGGLGKWLSPEFFRALSDPNRVAILARLAEGGAEQTVTEVASCCPINLSVVSRHLRTLREAGVLAAEKRGKEVFYSVKIQDLVFLLRNLANALEACCPDGLSRPTGVNDEA